MNRMDDLSEVLLPIYQYEISKGNQVERVDRPAGSNCPLAIVFRMPLDVAGFIALKGSPLEAKLWENRDRHYPLEKGFVCQRTRQAIAGPL